MGIHLLAGKGSGKSRLMGRIIAWLDFVRGIPLVIFDPHGPTIDNFLDKLTRMPRSIQQQLWPRVLYVDMSGRFGHVIPFPLYYQLGGESLYEKSQRYLDVIRKLDPHLQTASIEGWNPLWRTGTYTGMLLSAFNLQITEAETLLRNPLKWEGYFENLLNSNPETSAAIQFFKNLSEEKENIRNRRTDSFFNKIALFDLDPSMRAMFGASNNGVNWNQVVNNRMTVLLDFRHEHDIERRRFKMVWAFNYFLDFIKHRGAGRHQPIGLIVDELTSLFSVQALASDIFGSELDELINVIARNYSVWLTIAHQEQFQLTERMRKTLMTMGTQMIGVTTDREAALSHASHFIPYDPYLLKKREPIYMSYWGLPSIVDYRDIEFTIDEQLILPSYKFTNQECFQFLVRPAPGEGNVTGKLHQISIAKFDRDQYPEEELVAKARELLMKRNGRKIEDIIRELEVRIEPNFLESSRGSNLQEYELPVDEEIPFWSN